MPRRPSRAGTPRLPASSRRSPPQAPAGGRRPVQRAFVAAVGVLIAGALVAVGIALITHGSQPTVAVCPPDPAGWNGGGAGPLQRGTSPLTPHDPHGLWTPAWQYPTSDLATAVSGPPSAAGGTVYTVDGNGSLVALDARTGHLDWTSPAAAAEVGRALVPVALDGCSAVVATSFPDRRDGEPSGAVRAVDLQSHRRRWGVAVGDSVGSSPEIANGVVFVGVGIRRGSSLDRDWVVDGFNLSDPSGPFQERFRAAVIAAPATDGSRLYAAVFDNSVYAFAIEPSSRGLRQLWSFTTGGIITAAPVIGDGRLYVAGDDGLVEALDVGRNGVEQWHFDAGAPLDVTPVLDGSTLVVAGRDGGVHALDAASGRQRWSITLGAPLRGSAGGLAAAGDRVVAVDSTGIVHLLDLSTGTERAHWNGPERPLGPPAIAAGFAYVTAADGHLYALPL